MSWMFALDIVCCPVSVNNHLVFPIEVFQTLFLHKEILHKLDRSITNACSVAEMRHHLHVVSFQFAFRDLGLIPLRATSTAVLSNFCVFHLTIVILVIEKRRPEHSIRWFINVLPMKSLWLHYIDFCLSCSFDDVFHFLFLSRFFDDGEKGWVVKSLICNSLRPAVVFLDSISSHIPVSEV